MAECDAPACGGWPAGVAAAGQGPGTGFAAGDYRTLARVGTGIRSRRADRPARGCRDGGGRWARRGCSGRFRGRRPD